MTRRSLSTALIAAAILITSAAALIWWHVHNPHTPHASHASPSRAEDRVYHLGGRGGVYYLSPGGRRVYIDRERGLELYQQQQQKKGMTHEIHHSTSRRNADNR